MKTVTEDIKINDTLNPDLWENNELKEEVKEKLLDIVDNFLDILKEDKVNIDVVDVRFLGSNANYNYTDKSDIDLHIVADFSSTPCEQNVMPQLYNAYKSIFNSKYNISIYGHDVEIYVEDVNQPAKSNGVYSLYTGWIKEPNKSTIPNIDWEEFEKQFDEWEDRYFDIVGEHSSEFEKQTEPNINEDVNTKLQNDFKGETIRLYTIQDKYVLDKLRKGEVYTSNPNSITFSGYKKQYRYLSDMYGFKNYPIFLADESSKRIIEASGITPGGSKVMLTLDVPKSKVHKHFYYTWSDFLYFTDPLTKDMEKYIVDCINNDYPVDWSFQRKYNEDDDEYVLGIVKNDIQLLKQEKTESDGSDTQYVIDYIDPSWLVDTTSELEEGYGYKWKPNKAQAQEFAQKMKEISDFCRVNNIHQSSSGDSYYFELNGKNYRVSNHSVEASNQNSGGQWHKEGREKDTTYIHASKTRIMDIYNALKQGKKLDGRGNVINENLINHLDTDILDIIKDNKEPEDYINGGGIKCSKSAGYNLLKAYNDKDTKDIKLYVGGLSPKENDKPDKFIIHMWIEVDGKTYATHEENSYRVAKEYLQIDKSKDLYSQVYNFLNKDGLREDLSQEVDSEGNQLTPEQVEFFKNSKVRDDKGRLLVCYNGQPENYGDVYKTLKTSSVISGGQVKNPNKFGFFFSNSYDYASTYTNNSPSGIVKECYLNIDRILDLRKLSNVTTERKFVDFLNKQGAHILWTCSRKPTQIWEFFDDEQGQQFKRIIMGLNYNGIVFQESDYDTYVAFNSNQIKSIDNKNPSDSNNINEDLQQEVDSEGNPLTPEQVKFFKNSKVRDDKGRLLVCYHGTDAEFDVFDKNKIGNNTHNYGFYGKGFYFSNSSNYAREYSKEGKTKAYYLNISNPFYWNNYRTLDDFNEIKQKLNLDNEITFTDGYSPFAINIIQDKESANKFTQSLIRNNYNGVIFNYGDDLLEIVAFYPNQIKSIDNKNPSNSDNINEDLQEDLELTKNVQKLINELKEYNIELVGGKELYDDYSLILRSKDNNVTRKIKVAKDIKTIKSYCKYLKDYFNSINEDYDYDKVYQIKELYKKAYDELIDNSTRLYRYREWASNSNNDYKEYIYNDLKNNKKDSALNLWYNHYRLMTGNYDLSYEDFLNTPITLYRATNVKEDENSNNPFFSYAQDKRSAERFLSQVQNLYGNRSGKIKELQIKPKDTLGMLPSDENEIIVPNNSYQKRISNIENIVNEVIDYANKNNVELPYDRDELLDIFKKEGRDTENFRKHMFDWIDKRKGKLKESKLKENNDYGYHAGDLGKSEGRQRQTGGRGTGHFGTGTYFVGNPDKIKGYNDYQYGKGKAPHHIVDFSSYNLYKPSNNYYGHKLHDTLKLLNDGYKYFTTHKDDLEWFKSHNISASKSGEFEGKDIPEIVEHLNNLIGEYDPIKLPKDINYNTIDQEEDEVWDKYYDELKPQYKDKGTGEFFDAIDDKVKENPKFVEYHNLIKIIREAIEEELDNGTFDGLNDYTNLVDKLYNALEGRHSKEEIQNALNEVNDNLYSKVGDSLSTIFMKALGYEGVDTRHLQDDDEWEGLDNVTFGSVIYDLKPDTIVENNI